MENSQGTARLSGQRNTPSPSSFLRHDERATLIFEPAQASESFLHLALHLSVTPPDNCSLPVTVHISSVGVILLGRLRASVRLDYLPFIASWFAGSLIQSVVKKFLLYVGLGFFKLFERRHAVRQRDMEPAIGSGLPKEHRRFDFHAML